MRESHHALGGRVAMEPKLRLGERSNTDKRLLVDDLLPMVSPQQDAYSSSWIV